MDRVAKNVIWVIVDSVRNYHTDVDDRGRIKIMDNLAEKAIEFKTAITSAPSTVMSTSAMMTGVPSIYHSRTYNDFDFRSRDFNSLPLLLKKQGYNDYSIIFFPEGRQFLGPMMGNICKEHWTKDAHPNEFWSNDTVNNILESLLQKGLKEPFFLYVNYNCRYDAQTSEKVEKGLEMMRAKGLLDDSILVMNSDHGYPDPSRQLTMYERRKFGHDLIMTDDNILTPLIIQYPGCPVKSIKEPVSLLDVMPTILDYIALSEHFEVSQFPSHGSSLRPLIEGRESGPRPVVRTDNRYIFQDRRISSLRDHEYKYVFSFGDGAEEFYDLKKDPGELTNLANQAEYKEIKNKYVSLLRGQEAQIREFHLQKMTELFRNQLVPNAKIVAIIGDVHSRFKEMMVDVAALMDIQIDFFGLKDKLPKKQNYDQAFGVMVNHDPKDQFQTARLLRAIRATHREFVNYNFKKSEAPSHWVISAARRFWKKKIPVLKTDPKAFFADVRIMLEWLVAKR